MTTPQRDVNGEELLHPYPELRWTLELNALTEDGGERG